MEEEKLRKPKQQKKILDDIEELPEETEEDFLSGVDDGIEEDTTHELSEEDFNQFNSDLPKANDWE